MKLSILLFGAALLCSSMLRAAGVCVAPNTPELACIYSNFGGDQSYQYGAGLTPGYSAVGVAFTPYTSFVLMNLEVAAYRANGDILDKVTFSIYDSSGGFPGSVPETFQLTGLGVANGQPAPGTIMAASVLNPVLAGGMQYWIVMENVNPGDVTWNSNSTGQLGAATLLAPVVDGDPAYWFPLENYAQGTFALDGVPSPAPEPGTFVLGGCFVVLGLLRRRMHR